MTKTEELRKKFKQIVEEWFGENGLAYQAISNDKTFEDDLIQANKEMGLEFVVEDAELPEVETFCYLAWVECIPKLTVQQGMLKANFKKTEKIEV